jgi:hypothetical protein
MPPVGFEQTISVLERAKTVCGLDRAATAIGKVEVEYIGMSAVALIAVNTVVADLSETRNHSYNGK